MHIYDSLDIYIFKRRKSCATVIYFTKAKTTSCGENNYKINLMIHHVHFIYNSPYTLYILREEKEEKDDKEN